MKVLTFESFNVILLAAHFFDCRAEVLGFTGSYTGGINHGVPDSANGTGYQGPPGFHSTGPDTGPFEFPSSSTAKSSTTTTSSATTTTSTKTTSTTRATISKTTPNLNSTSPKTHFSDFTSSTIFKGLLAGLVIFFILFLLSLGLAVWCCLRWRNLTSKLRNTEERERSTNFRSKPSKIDDEMKIHVKNSDDMIKSGPSDLTSDIHETYYNIEFDEKTDSQYAGLDKASALDHVYADILA